MMTQVPVLGSDGKPLLDEDGNPIFESKTIEMALGEDGKPVMLVEVPELGPDGQPLLGEDGKPIMKKVPKAVTPPAVGPDGSVVLIYKLKMCFSFRP